MEWVPISTSRMKQVVPPELPGRRQVVARANRLVVVSYFSSSGNQVTGVNQVTGDQPSPQEMPTRKVAPMWHAAPAVEAQLMTEEMVAPVAEAIEVPAEDATPNDGLAGKRSRAYEVFEADLNDTNYIFCQCRERVVGGNVCRKRVKCCHCPATPWSHLKSKHPVTHASLKACDGDCDTRASTAEERLAQPAQLAVNVSYQQMVDSLSRAPLEVLADAIAALQQAREERSQHV